ncbi:MAG: hypothetical protein BZY88_15935, partial [SAR202 cluster bacterium Io17-Chloro-G9]
MASLGQIKAGIPVSLTGQFQVQGKQALAGLQAWASDVNSTGGVSVGETGGIPKTRRALEVVFHDDASTIEGVRRATEALITQDRVDLLFGPYSSVLTAQAAAAAEKHQRVLWNHGGASDDVYQQGYQRIIGILTPATEYLAGLLPLVRESDAGAHTVGILRAARGAFPKAVTSAVERDAEALGFNLEFVWEYPSSADDFRDLAAAAAGQQPDVLVAVGRIPNDLALALSLVEWSHAFKAVAVVAAPIDQFRQALGSNVDGFLGPSQWEPAARYPVAYGPNAADVLQSLNRQSSQAVDYPMVQAYAAGLVAQRCVETAGSLEDAALGEAASQLDFSTFYGRFKIDPQTGRQVGRKVILVQWQKGRKVLVWP